ncbi:hypothetical protein D049_1411A, partial [Vibrio parahaemolyticus VPTS-2010]
MKYTSGLLLTFEMICVGDKPLSPLTVQA